MGSPNDTATSTVDQTVALKPEPSAPITAISARLWAFGGSRARLRDLNLEPEGPLTEVLNTLVQESEGRLAGTRQSTLVAHFENPLRALTGAKLLQQKLLALPKGPEDEQFAAAIVVHGWGIDDASGSTTSSRETLVPKRRLVEANLGRILVTAGIRDMARDVADFQFGPRPVPKSDGGSASGNLFELLWTDETTYARLRKAAQTAGVRMPKLTRYEIQSELGRGSMGVVYRATDKLIGRTVALKTIVISSTANTDQEELVERLRLEAKTAGQLDHPNIITIFDVGQEEDLVYLSMQFVEGTTIGELLTEGKLPPMSALLSYADQICAAVGFAHQKGVIHRDLKPANLMLTPQGTVKILDFGIAKLGDVSLTQSGLVVGTPTHMSPEQAMGRKLDQRSDIFSLGAVFYEIFTRERPFKGDISAIFYKIIHEDPAPPSVINPSLAIGIDAIIRKALAKDPKQRFQSCEEMRAAFREQATLLAAASGSHAPAKPTTGIPPLPRANAPTSGTHKIPRSTVVPQSNSTRILLLLCLLAAVGFWSLEIRPDWKAATLAQWDKLVGNSTNNQHADDGSSTTTQSGSADISNTGSAGLNSNINAAGSAGTTTATGSTTTAGSAAVSATPATTTANSGSSATGSAAISEGTDTSGSAATTQTPSTETAADNSKNHKHASHDRDPQPNKKNAADIDELLGRAHRYEQSNDATMAAFTYHEVLKLDSRNKAAKAGLARLNSQ